MQFIRQLSLLTDQPCYRPFHLLLNQSCPLFQEQVGRSGTVTTIPEELWMIMIPLLGSSIHKKFVPWFSTYAKGIFFPWSLDIHSKYGKSKRIISSCLMKVTNSPLYPQNGNSIVWLTQLWSTSKRMASQLRKLQSSCLPTLPLAPLNPSMEMLGLVHVVLCKHSISNVVTTKSEIKGDCMLLSVPTYSTGLMLLHLTY